MGFERAAPVVETRLDVAANWKYAYGTYGEGSHFAALHPAIDVSATRFGEPAVDALQLVADLARLGLVVPGRAKRLEPGTLAIRLGAPGSRRRGDACDLAAALAAAAEAARRFGGLPAGALLVVAGLTPPLPEAAMSGPIIASLGALGRAEAILA